MSLPIELSSYRADLDERYAQLLKENHRKYFYDDEAREAEAAKLTYEVLLLVGLSKTAAESVAYYNNPNDIQ